MIGTNIEILLSNVWILFTLLLHDFIQHSMTCRHPRLTGYIPRHNWLLSTWSRIFTAGFSYDEEPQGLFAGYRPDHEVYDEAEADDDDDDADPHKKNKLRPDHQVFDFAGRTLLTDVSVTFW